MNANVAPKDELNAGTRARDTPCMSSSRLEEPSSQVRVEGKLPGWLVGRLLRTAPAVFKTDGWPCEHWFRRLGMLYAFDFGPRGQSSSDSGCSTASTPSRLGAAMCGCQAFAGSLERRWVAALAGADRAGERQRQREHRKLGVPLAGDDRVSAATRDRTRDAQDRERARYEDGLPRDLIMTAHPQYDFQRGCAINVGTRIRSQCELLVFSHPPSSRRRELVGAGTTCPRSLTRTRWARGAARSC